MGRFVEAADRHQASFLPACLEDYVDPDNPVRIIDAFGLVGGGMVAIDGSRLRAVNTHEKNYTKGKLARRKAHVEESIARYLAELEETDRAETGPATPRTRT